MALTELEKKVVEAIDKNAEKIIELGDKIYNNPELGYKEYETAKTVEELFCELGLDVKTNLALTGVSGKTGKADGVNVAILGELDGIYSPNHPHANKETGAVHACGHHSQLASMLGAAIGIVNSGVMENLGGAVTFMAVPAEEFQDLDYRRKIIKEGKVKFIGGKQQLIHDGVFDDIDMAMMVHAQPDTPMAEASVHGKNLGFVEKEITFKGKASHASEPWGGVNALNAAALAILGIHSNREHFKEEDKVRIHPIITKGGDAVNIVPSEVTIDTYVRASNVEAMQNAAEDTDRSVFGAAQMVGAKAQIKTIAGFLPLKQDYQLGEIFKEYAKEFIPAEHVREDIDPVGSTDMGDLSAIMPVIQPTIGGFTGALHSNDFCTADKMAAYVTPAKIMALTAVRLLVNDCEEGERIKQQFKADMTKEEYLDMIKKTEKVEEK